MYHLTMKYIKTDAKCNMNDLENILLREGACHKGRNTTWFQLYETNGKPLWTESRSVVISGVQCGGYWKIGNDGHRVFEALELDVVIIAQLHKQTKYHWLLDFQGWATRCWAVTSKRLLLKKEKSLISLFTLCCTTGKQKSFTGKSALTSNKGMISQASVRVVIEVIQEPERLKPAQCKKKASYFFPKFPYYLIVHSFPTARTERLSTERLTPARSTAVLLKMLSED